MPTVAVVVVNYRTPDLVGECLDAVPAAAGPLDLEVVVVDNASGDGSPGSITERHPEARVVERPFNDGFGAGVNAGFAGTTAPYVVVLNPDALAEPGAIERLVAHLDRNPRAGMAAPSLVSADGRTERGAYRRFPSLPILFLEFCAPLGHVLLRIPRLDPYRVPPDKAVEGMRIAHAYGAAMAIRRAAYEDVGPFDEGFFLYLEETEWQRRLGHQGWHVELVPSARVKHLVRGGGDAALVPSAHFVDSAYRYFALLGKPKPAVRATMASGAVISWLGMAAVAPFAGSRREVTRRTAAGWRGIARDLLRRH